MAEGLKRVRIFVQNNYKLILEAFLYAIMIILICIYFKGNGQFIYEMVI